MRTKGSRRPNRGRRGRGMRGGSGGGYRRLTLPFVDGIILSRWRPHLPASPEFQVTPGGPAGLSGDSEAEEMRVWGRKGGKGVRK